MKKLLHNILIKVTPCLIYIYKLFYNFPNIQLNLKTIYWKFKASIEPKKRSFRWVRAGKVKGALISESKRNNKSYKINYYIDDKKYSVSASKSIPSIKFYKFKNCIIFKGDDFVLNDGKLLVGDLFNWKIFVHPLESRGLILSNNHQTIRMIQSEGVEKKLKKIVYIASSLSSNYFHFWLEIMPRIFLAAKKVKYKDYPILLSKDTPNSIKQFLRRNFKNTKFIYSSSYKNYCVEELIIISEPGFTPYNLRKLPHKFNCDFIHYPTFNMLRNLFIPKLNKRDAIKKVFILRKSNRRKINNMEGVLSLAQFYGYTIICTSSFDIEEQIRIFYQADYLLGVIGAEFINTIFCRPSCLITAISTSSTYGNYNLLPSLISGTAKARLNYFTCKPDDIVNVHSNINVDLKKFNAYLSVLH